MTLASQRPTTKAVATLLTVALGVVTLGCQHWHEKGPHDTRTSFYNDTGLSIEYPDVHTCETPVKAAAYGTKAPLSLEDPSELQSIDMTLEEAITYALQQSPVIRSLPAGSVLNTNNASTVFDPALVASSGQGTEAALSAFDAEYSNSIFWNSVDRPNNIQTGGLGGQFTPAAARGRDATYQAQLTKRTATGSRFSVRNIVNYSQSNQPFRQFSTDFAGWVEGEWRQPLLRGAGLEYNRIVGGSIVPGQYNGVLVARINEDVSLANFEESVVKLVSDVERAYWDLVVAYRVFATTVKGREAALRTYQYQKVRLDVGSGRQDEEAQAKSQYYQFQTEVQRALSGPTGLYASEQYLRYLIGWEASDGNKIIRPTTEPVDAKVVFDWNAALSQSLERRVELRRQRMEVKRRELELYAARLNKRPQLDLVGLYRFRGLGDHLFGDNGNGNLDGMYATIADGNYQEWQAGIEFLLPVGLRQAATAVTNAQLALQRERAILHEAELKGSHDLANASRNVDVTHQLVEANYNRYQADLRQVEVLLTRYLNGKDNINFLLQAQRSVVVSEASFYRALSDYNLAIRDLHREKGTLLAYNQVQLMETPWAAGANYDAYHKGLFMTRRAHPERVQIARPVVRGAFDPSEPQITQGAPESIATPVPDAAQVEGE